MIYPSDRFAAWLSYDLIWEGGPFPFKKKEDGDLYNRTLAALEGRYANTLLHLPAYHLRMSAEEAAQRYFERILERPLQLSPRVQISVGHQLFEALCQRAADPAWRHASVRREKAGTPPPGATCAVPAAVRGMFEQCRARLGELPDGVSRGSPSPALRARHGELVLRLQGLAAPVPEEISLWSAIRCAPAWLSFPEREAFDAFCCIMIDCMRTVHRPFSELLALKRGLCPFDWLDVLSIQQTRRLRVFLAELGDGPDTLPRWEQAWERRRVSGFESATDLWHSEIGRALRQPQGRIFISNEQAEEALAALSADEDPAEVAERGQLLGEEALREQLDPVVSDGAISAQERDLLLALAREESLEVEESLANDLLGRIERWWQSRCGGGEEKDGGDEMMMTMNKAEA